MPVPSELEALHGVGPGKSALLTAARECCCRYMGEKLAPGRAIAAPADSQDFLLARLRDRSYEVFCCIFLDNRHRVLAFEELFRGTIDNTTVYPREVVRQALHRNAAAVILAHNHPSGMPEPSDADRLITRRIRDALELIDVRLLDHFVDRGRQLRVPGQPGHAVDAPCPCHGARPAGIKRALPPYGGSNKSLT